MKYFYLVLFFLIFSLQLKAQYIIKGRVIDKENNKHISNVKLFRQGTEIVEINNEGNFEFRSDSEKVNVVFKYKSNINKVSLKDSISNLQFLEKTEILLSNKFNLVYLNNTIQGFNDIVLNEVTVTGYNNNRSISEIPASIATLSNSDLKRFSNTYILPAINTIPGVRMEERSPGSFRLAIRGSSLRSPFGVRNVKVYWNDIPFTDAEAIHI